MPAAQILAYASGAFAFLATFFGAACMKGEHAVCGQLLPACMAPRRYAITRLRSSMHERQSEARQPTFLAAAGFAALGFLTAAFFGFVAVGTFTLGTCRAADRPSKSGHTMDMLCSLHATRPYVAFSVHVSKPGCMA